MQVHWIVKYLELETCTPTWIVGVINSHIYSNSYCGYAIMFGAAHFCVHVCLTVLLKLQDQSILNLCFETSNMSVIEVNAPGSQIIRMCTCTALYRKYAFNHPANGSKRWNVLFVLRIMYIMCFSAGDALPLCVCCFSSTASRWWVVWVSVIGTLWISAQPSG